MEEGSPPILLSPVARAASFFIPFSHFYVTPPFYFFCALPPCFSPSLNVYRVAITRLA